MSESIGNDHGYLCPNCKQGNDLTVVVLAYAKLSHDGSEVIGDHEWDGSNRAFCGCQWNGLVSDLITLPAGEGKMFICANCDTEFYENQCDDVDDPQERFLPGDTWTDKQCPSCGALAFPL